MKTYIYSARSNTCHHPTSPNTAPAYTQSMTRMLDRLQSLHPSHKTSFPMRGATGITIQPHQILRLPRKMTLQDFKENLPKNRWNVISNAGPIRAWSEHDPSMIRPWKRKPQPASQVRLLFQLTTKHFSIVKYNVSRPILHSNLHQILRLPRKVTLELTNTAPATKSAHLNFTKCCACHEKWHLNFTKYCACHAKDSHTWVVITYETWFTMRGATGVTIQPHQILRLARRKTHILSPHHIWNVIYNARSNRCHHPTSPNTAPDHEKWLDCLSSSHMKRHFQCAEQQVSLSNLTKYCACHEKWHCKISKKISKNRWNVISNAGPIRPWSENDPTMIRPWSEHENANRNPPRKWGYFSSSPRSIFYCKIQRFAPNLTFKPSPNTAPATKSATWTSPNTAPATKSDTWTSPSTAPATKSDTWTSPSTAPATKSDTWTSPSTAPATKSDTWTSPSTATCHEKWHLNFTKYCACHCTVTDHENKLLYSTLLDNVSTLLDQLLYLTLLYVTLLYQVLYLLLLYLTLLYLTYSTWLLLYLTLLYLTTLLDSTLLDSTLLDSTLLDSTWHYSTWLYLTLLTLLDSTLLDSTSTWLYSTWLYSTWLYSTWLYLILLDSTLLDTTLLDLLYLTLLDSTLLDSTLLDSTLLDTILLDSTWFYLTLLDSTLLDSTLLDTILLDSTLTWLYSTWLYSTWLYSDLTLLYLTLLYLT